MNVTLMEAEYWQCRTVLGGTDAKTLMCGDRVKPGRSYCAACCDRYFVPVKVIRMRYQAKGRATGAEARQTA